MIKLIIWQRLTDSNVHIQYKQGQSLKQKHCHVELLVSIRCVKGSLLKCVYFGKYLSLIEEVCSHKSWVTKEWQYLLRPILLTEINSNTIN